MTLATKALAIKALQSYMGDDLERAQLSFRDFSRDGMDRPYGQSGRTPRQILQDHQDRRLQIARAIEEIQLA